MSHVFCHIFVFFVQYGTTPLIWAARKGHYESVMHLLANGADVDQEGAVSTVNGCLIVAHSIEIIKYFKLSSNI